MIGRHKAFQQRHLKRFQVETRGVATIQRFPIIEKNLVHQPIDASTNDKIDFRFSMVFIPNRRDLAEHGRIDPIEFLKFIQDYRKSPR